MEQEQRNPFLGINDVGQAEKLFDEYRIKYPKDTDGQLRVLSELLDALFATEDQITGEADDFHNFAVTASRVANDNKDAYAVVREGLKIHDINTDLLADALMYGANAGEKAECEKWYEVLLRVDKSKWTWRAFSFTITYLLNLYASSDSGGTTIDDILSLAKEYQKNLPDDESAWISLYRIYDRTNQRAKGVEVLEDAIKKFQSCPKCWLRYADAMLDDGFYKKAEPVIKKMLRDPNTTEHVNTSYIYFLDGKCKMAKLIDSDAYWDGEVDEKEVKKIYRSFILARKLEGLRENVNQRIEEYVNRLSFETGIPYEG